jgi:stringent starvation protein B
VKDGEIVLNISMNATRHLTIDRDLVQFSARFNGVSQEVRVPIERVSGIFARENGHGAFFQVEVAAPKDGAAPAVADEAVEVTPLNRGRFSVVTPNEEIVSEPTPSLELTAADQRVESEPPTTETPPEPPKPRRPSLTVVK